MRHTALLPCMLCVSLAGGPARADYASGEAAYQRGDFRRALYELTPVADQDARAARLLSRIHAQGLGAGRDPHQALLWLRKAGELGDAAAQFDLGEAYAHGRAAPADPREAVLWYTRAAEQGHPGAQFELGKRYARGGGVPPDASQANHWIGRAVAADLPQARAWVGLAPAQEEPVTAPAPASRPPDTALAEPPAGDAGQAPARAEPPPHIQWHWGMSYGCCGPGWPYWGWRSWYWYPSSGSSVYFGIVIQD